VEVQLFRRGRPVTVFRSPLGGWSQDQLEVGDILEQHGLKSVFAFDPATRKRGVAIRFNPRNGRSLLTYAPDSTIFLDGEPKVLLELAPPNTTSHQFHLTLLFLDKGIEIPASTPSGCTQHGLKHSST
jgi:hypothetical protein